MADNGLRLSPAAAHSEQGKGATHVFMMSACSSIRLPSPITIGPASAMIRA